jgi:hypothetical protein
VGSAKVAKEVIGIEGLLFLINLHFELADRRRLASFRLVGLVSWR